MPGLTDYTTADGAKLYFLSGTNVQSFVAADAPTAAEMLTFASTTNLLSDTVSYTGGVQTPVEITETGWGGKSVSKSGTPTRSNVTVTAFFKRGGMDSTKTVEFTKFTKGTSVQFVRAISNGADVTYIYQRVTVSVLADVTIEGGSINKAVCVFTADTNRSIVDKA